MPSSLKPRPTKRQRPARVVWALRLEPALLAELRAAAAEGEVSAGALAREGIARELAWRARRNGGGS